MIRPLLVALAITLASTALVYQKVVLDDPDAKCLDGSQGAYYIWQGDPAKVLIFIEGGGWCGDNSLSATTENCYQRSKTDLGSSTGYKQTQSFGSGILSDHADNYFNGWTRVFLKYCDGSGHQGYKKDAINYKGAMLYFRGHNITTAQFNSINKSNKIFTSAVTHLVLTGESAGGLATFHWTNYLASQLDKNTKFWSIPDSGVFVDEVNALTQQNSYRIWFQNIMAIANLEIGTPIPECNELYKDELWKCMFAQHIHRFINVPLFAPQSLYDSWSLYNIIGIRCIDGVSLSRCNKNELALIESYHQSTMQVLFEISSKNENGVWGPVCINHCYLSNDYYSSKNYRIPQTSEYSLIRSVKDWMENADENPRHMDFGSWPGNSPCSGASLSISQNE